MSFIRLHGGVLEARETYMRASEEVGYTLQEVLAVIVSWLQPVVYRVVAELEHGGLEFRGAVLADVKRQDRRIVSGVGVFGLLASGLTRVRRPAFIRGDGVARYVAGPVKRVYGVLESLRDKYRGVAVRLELGVDWLLTGLRLAERRSAAVYVEGSEDLLRELYSVVARGAVREWNVAWLALKDDRSVGECQPCPGVVVVAPELMRNYRYWVSANPSIVKPLTHSIEDVRALAGGVAFEPCETVSVKHLFKSVEYEARVDGEACRLINEAIV